MLHLEKVNGNNVWDILKLAVSESQKNFVATNGISIIEAYTAGKVQKTGFGPGAG